MEHGRINKLEPQEVRQHLDRNRASGTGEGSSKETGIRSVLFLQGLDQFIAYLIRMSTKAPPCIELIAEDSNYSKVTS